MPVFRHRWLVPIAFLVPADGSTCTATNAMPCLYALDTMLYGTNRLLPILCSHQAECFCYSTSFTMFFHPTHWYQILQQYICLKDTRESIATTLKFGCCISYSARRVVLPYTHNPPPHPTTLSKQPGTLVHYYENEAEAPGLPEVIPLPASATGRMGRISLETLKLAARVRSSGARLVLVSGTRYSTFANRLPYLPRADAYVIENGGRIFYPKEAVKESDQAEKGGDGQSTVSSPEISAVGDPSLTGHSALALTEDLTWRQAMESATGSASQDAKAPEDREGPLWDLYRRAVLEGFEVDTNTYYTMLRYVAIVGRMCVGGHDG